MDSEYVDPEELPFLMARDEEADEELINRMTEAPDMGGAALMQLSAFVVSRQEARMAGGAACTSSLEAKGLSQLSDGHGRRC